MTLTSSLLINLFRLYITGPKVLFSIYSNTRITLILCSYISVTLFALP